MAQTAKNNYVLRAISWFRKVAGDEAAFTYFVGDYIKYRKLRGSMNITGKAILDRGREYGWNNVQMVEWLTKLGKDGHIIGDAYLSFDVVEETPGSLPLSKNPSKESPLGEPSSTPFEPFEPLEPFAPSKPSVPLGPLVPFTPEWKKALVTGTGIFVGRKKTSKFTSLVDKKRNPSNSPQDSDTRVKEWLDSIDASLTDPSKLPPVPTGSSLDDAYFAEECREMIRKISPMDPDPKRRKLRQQCEAALQQLKVSGRI